MAANEVIGVRMSQEDTEFIDRLAEKNMSYRSTIAKRLLHEKIKEMRAAETATQEQNREGSEND